MPIPDPSLQSTMHRAGRKLPVGGLVLGTAFELLVPAPIHEKVAGVGAVGVSTALGFGVTKFAGMLVGGVVEMGAYFAARAAFSAAQEATKSSAIRWRSVMQPGFQTTEAYNEGSTLTLTQRQASIRAIQSSVLNARSSIGNEAAMMRRSVDEYL